jgi:hypothetical protein
MSAVNGVGKPCAREPHARFDGRELETEQRSGQGHGDEGHQGKPCGHPRLRDLPPIHVTAPALDPTCGGFWGVLGWLGPMLAGLWGLIVLDGYDESAGVARWAGFPGPKGLSGRLNS